VVYITEAHPSDVWQMQSNIKDQVVFASPKNEEERAFIAGACVRKLGIEFYASQANFVLFRAGERANDPGKMMRTIAARLSDQEIKSVSEYMAGLR